MKPSFISTGSCSFYVLNNAATTCHVWKITQCCVTLRPIFLISINSTRPRKGKKQTNKQKNRLTSQTSGSISRTESCRSTLTVCSDGKTNLRTVFGYLTRKSKMIYKTCSKINKGCSSHNAVLERVYLVCYCITLLY